MEKNSHATPLVGIIMGIDSDWPTLQPAAEACAEFGVACEVRVVSAHRTPDEMARFAKSAYRRGRRVIIAGAGGAANLPGMVASLTPLPVIGVPVESRSLKGLDSLLSIVQMPAGVPVATVASGGGKVVVFQAPFAPSRMELCPSFTSRETPLRIKSTWEYMTSILLRTSIQTSCFAVAFRGCTNSADPTERVPVGSAAQATCTLQASNQGTPCPSSQEPTSHP